MNRKNILTLIKKELAVFYHNLSSYLVLVVFLFFWEFMFFRNAFLVGESSLRLLFDLLPWILLIFVPAVTMASLSKEKEDGTLEILLTHPVTDLELILAKWLSAVTIIVSALVFTLPVALSFSLFGRFDWGIFLGQLLAGFFFAAALSSLGIFVSSLIGNQVAVLLVTLAAGFGFQVAGAEFLTARLPLWLVPVLERLSLSSHFDSLSRGVIDTRDLWYFLSFSAIFICLTLLQLFRRRYGNLKSKYLSFQTGVALLVGIAVLTNVLGSRIPGRIDLTWAKIYTLSSGTKKILRQLPDVVNITLYSSGKLPAQYSPIVREIKDVLKDFQKIGGSRLVVSLKDPSSDQKASAEASAKGIQEMQFNVIGEEEFQVKTGFLGLVLEYAGKQETLPFIQETEDLEYQLASNIWKLTNKNKKKVQFLTLDTTQDQSADLQTFFNEVGKQFDISNEVKIATDASVLVVIGAKVEIGEPLQKEIKNYEEKGGSVLFLAEMFEVSPQMPTASPNANDLNDILSVFGVTVKQNAVYDLRANELVSMGSQEGFNYLLPYPFWVRALPAKSDSPILTQVNYVTLPWASSLDLEEKKIEESGYLAKKLLVTTGFAGEKSGNFSITPNEGMFDQKDLAEKLLAVSLQPKDQSKKGKIIIIGNRLFLTDQFLQNSPGNLDFGLSALSWLAQEEILSAIRSRKSISGKLLFQSDLQTQVVKYGNMVLAFAVPVIFGIWIIGKRRRKHNLVYENNG